MATLSIVIITKNSEQDIEKCLKSVDFADEIIVLDSGSTDNTVSICKKYTSSVFETDWPGFGMQKNRALGYAKSDWVLSLDSDEWVSKELKQEILNLIQSNQNYTYSIPRKSYYCGKLIKYGHWSSDKVIRLFKNKSAKFSNDKIHEKLLPTHPIKQTKNFLLHNSFKTHEEVLAKMNSYSTLTAELKLSKGKNGGLFKAITHGLWSFIRSYILKLGFLDGKQGLMLAISFAEGSYYRYVKMLQLSQNNNIN